MYFKNAVITPLTALLSSLRNQYQQVLNTRGGCQTSVQTDHSTNDNLIFQYQAGLEKLHSIAVASRQL